MDDSISAGHYTAHPGRSYSPSMWYSFVQSQTRHERNLLALRDLLQRDAFEALPSTYSDNTKSERAGKHRTPMEAVRCLHHVFSEGVLRKYTTRLRESSQPGRARQAAHRMGGERDARAWANPRAIHQDTAPQGHQDFSLPACHH